MKTICLNMIVKNESCVIRRCLDSIKGYIDTWVIVDTGSTDRTQEILRDSLQDIPGELHERPWVNFETNRNEALDLARNKANYTLFIDADETLEFEKPLDKNALCSNFYAVKNRDLSVDFYRILLIDQDPFWRWEGPLHETLLFPKKSKGEILPHILRIGTARDSARAKNSGCYLKDAEELEKKLQRDPNNSRTVFYLAQSYGSAGEKRKALEHYRRRFSMGGNTDERFLSLYYCGCLREDLNEDIKQILKDYEKAYHFDPQRAEPLAAMARYFLKSNRALPAYLLAKFGLTHPPPKTLMYVRREVYDEQLLFLSACAAQSLGRQEEAKIDYYKLLSKKELSENTRKRVLNNLSLF